MVSPAPRFTVATAKALEPLEPGISIIPSFVAVATNATMSAAGAAGPANSSELTPAVTGAGDAFAQENLKLTPVGITSAVGVRAMTNVWCARKAGEFQPVQVRPG